MASHTSNNFVGSHLSVTTHGDHVTKTKPTNKRKRDVSVGKRRRNNTLGKLTSSSYLPASLHDTNNLCLCLSLSCLHTTTHDHETSQITKKKKKTCNYEAFVGKQNNLGLLQPIDDLSVCLHFLVGSPSCVPTCCHDHEQTTKKTPCNADEQQLWEIKKVLETSDICKHKTRLLLNKDLAEKFVVPVLLDGAFGKGGVQVQVWDIDTKSPHSVVFKYWPSAKSYVFTKTWTKEFVNRRELKKDDQIGLRWDRNNQRFDFSVLKKP
ncbi:putative transcription factor B3-Domain family [Medicago truncatula]|uniref:Putative transcription factor B3-Domain family n=1 Tax=Medicago truncatula TaxID=3880 RepID=A0A396JVL7_MEDTR|nr:putative transcription factor B3-Domain family [Medicago truncatula]